MKLDKDDLYEIEKIIDIYAGWTYEKLNNLCKTATNYSALRKRIESPLDFPILELRNTYNRLKALRDKLEQMRTTT